MLSQKGLLKAFGKPVHSADWPLLLFTRTGVTGQGHEMSEQFCCKLFSKKHTIMNDRGTNGLEKI